MSITDDQLQQIFEYMESVNPRPNNPRYRESNNLNFGEERYGEIPGEERTQFEVDKFASVKTLADKITTHLFGEAKFSEDIKGTYIDIVNARNLIGKKGIKGMNRKGMICVCIIINLTIQGVHIDIKNLVKAANKVDNNTAQTSSKMIMRYLDIALELLKLQNQNNNIQNKSLTREFKRLAIKFGFDRRQIAQLSYKSRSIDGKILSQHTPHIIASAILFHDLNAFNKTKDEQKQILKILDVSKMSMLKVFKKLYPELASLPKF